MPVQKSNCKERIKQNYDCVFDFEISEFTLIGNIMDKDCGRGVQNFNSLGFNNSNEEVEEPYDPVCYRPS